MIFTCPRCARSYAVPDGFAGLLCPCAGLLTPILPGAGAPSPASTTPESASHRSSSGLMDGGSGKPEGPPFQREGGGRTPPSGNRQGGKPNRPPIPPAELSEAEKDPAKLTEKVDWRLVENWFDGKFYVKGGIDSGQFTKLIGAAKAYGYTQDKDGGIRDYLKGLKEGGSKAASDLLAAILMKAGAIEGPKGG